MAAFQTLREHRALPLVKIDQHGNMRWVAYCVFCRLFNRAGTLTQTPGRPRIG
jgi:hypothetical protein